MTCAVTGLLIINYLHHVLVGGGYVMFHRACLLLVAEQLKKVAGGLFMKFVE